MQERPILWTPQAGPQEKFVKSSAFEVLYGGAAGGGKTEGLIYDAVGHCNHPAARVLFLRRTFPELREVMDRCHAVFPQLGAEWRASDKRWKFPTGATFEFGYSETYEDIQQFQGQEFSYVGWDEIGHIPEERTWQFILSRIRSKDKTLRVYARATANPGGPGHAWVKRRFVDATNAGQITYIDPAFPGLTRQFIPARVTDNPALLEANPLYLAQLNSLPDSLRKQLLEGDWNAGTAYALDELGERTHLVEPFEIPSHWYRFGGLDWGYAHPWWFIGGAQDSNGDVYVTHVITGRRDLPDDIAAKIKESSVEPRSGELVPVAWQVIAAGLDVWHQVRARGEIGPTIAERLQGQGLPLIRATVSRPSGLNNLRFYTALRNRDYPKLRFFDTPACRKLIDQLRTIVVDPDRPEDSLKVDANPDTGIGGDDGYDALRYMMMLRPYTAQPASQRESPFTNLAAPKDPLVIPSSDEFNHITAGQWLGGM